MSTRRQLALTLLAVIIAAPVLMVLWPTTVTAPPIEVANPPEEMPPPSPDTAPEDGRKPSEPEPVEPDDEQVLSLRLVDDATGDPLRNLPGRFGLINWRRDDAFMLYDVPTERHLYWFDFTSNEEGRVPLPQPVSDDDLRTGHSPLYPLPFGWVPVTPARELFDNIEQHIAAGTIGLVEVRLRRGLTLTVSCVDETGAPTEGVAVRVIPDLANSFTHAMFPRRVDDVDWDALLLADGQPIPAPRQEGDGGTTDGHYEFESDGSDIDFPDMPAQWTGISDEYGIVELTDIPQGLCLLSATQLGTLAHFEELKLAADATRQFTFARTASLTLHVRWHGEAPGREYVSIVGMGGELDLVFRNATRMTVELTGLPPGRHDLNLLDINHPPPAINLEPGHNVATLHLGPEAYAEWFVELTVNGQKLEYFDIEMRHTDSPRFSVPWGTLPAQGTLIRGLAKFEEGKPAEVRPGLYLVKLPDGEVREMTFQPGQDVTSRFDIKVREVTFSITREFADWIGGEDDSGISLSASSYVGAYAFDCLREALTGYPYNYTSALDELAPGHPVKLGLPPDVYGLTLTTQWPNAIYQNEIDLSDPALTHVEFSMDGWPGVAAYHIHRGEVAMWVADDAIWLLEYSWYDDVRDVYTCFLPTKSFAGHFVVGEKQRRRCWIAEPGTYKPKPDWGYGEWSISLPEQRKDAHYDGWVSWERGGIRFFCDLKESSPATELPSGPMKVCLECAEWPDGTDGRVTTHATFELDLQGDIVIDPARLEWRGGGEIRLLCPKNIDNDSEYYGGESWFAQDFGIVDRGDHVVLASGPMPDDEYYVIVIIAGRAIETRTVRIENGKDVVIDLRN